MSRAIIPVVFLFAVSAGAQVNWTGTGGNSDWLNGGNWDVGVPGSADSVHIDVLNTTVDFSGSGSAFDLHLGETNTGVLLNLNSGGNLTLSDAGLFLHNGAVLNVNDGGALSLTLISNAPLFDAGTALNINDGGSMTLNAGGFLAWQNDGDVNLTAGVGDAILQLNGATVQMFGSTGGTVTLGSTGVGTARITGMTGFEDMTIGPGQSLHGFGEITNMGFHAQGDSGGAGVVNADVTGQVLHLSASASGSISIDNLGSNGVFQASNGGALHVDYSAGGFVNNGLLRADAGSAVTVSGDPSAFQNYHSFDQSLNGGTFSTAGTMKLAIGDIQTNNSNIVLEGGAVLQDLTGHDVLATSLQTNNGTLTVSGGGTLALNSGSFTNQGTVQVLDAGSTLDLSAVNLANHLQVSSTGDSVFQLGTWSISGDDALNPTRVILNAPSGPIRQLGQLTALGYPGVDPANRTFLTLQGAGALLTDDGAQDALRALEAINSNGTLTLINHDFTTAGGFLVDGTLSLQNSNFTVTGGFRNLDSGNLVGGTFDLGGTSMLLHSGGDILTLGDGVTPTSLTLRGPDALITSDGFTDSLANLSHIQAQASLTLVDRDFFSFASDFLNDGNLTVRSETCSCPAFVAFGDFTNNGVVTLAGNGIDEFTGGNLEILGNLTNVHSDGTLVGGTYNVSDFSEITYNGAQIAQIGDGVTPTSITLHGFDAFISNDGGFSDALGGLTTIAKAGSLTLDTYDMSTPGDFTNNGTLTLRNSYFIIGDAGDFALTNVNGAGVLQGGTYNVLDGSLLIYSGPSIQQIGSGNPGDAPTAVTLSSFSLILATDGQALQLAKIASNGSLTLTDTFGPLETPGDFTNDGSLTLNNSTFLVGAGGGNAITNISGAGVMTGGSYTLTGSSMLQYTGSGITQLGDDATHTPTSITLQGNALITTDGATDALAPLAKISENSSLTLIDRPSTFVTQGDFTNNGSLTLNNSSFTVNPGNSLTNFNAGTGTLAGGSWTLLGNSNLQFDNTGIVNLGDGVQTTTAVVGGGGKFTNDGTTNSLSSLAHIATNASLRVQDGTTLNTVPGALTVDGGLTVTGGSTLSIDNGALIVNGDVAVRDHSSVTAIGLDVGSGGSLRLGEASQLIASGGNFMALDGAGTLLRGTYEIDGLLDRTGTAFEFSAIHFGGAADGSHPGIQTIGAGVSLTLNGFGAYSPFIDEGADPGHGDALSSLHRVDGTLVLENAFQKTFSNPNDTGFTPFNMVNNGHISLQGSVAYRDFGYPTILNVNGQFTNAAGAELDVRRGSIFNFQSFNDPNYQPSFSNAGKLVVEDSAMLGSWLDLSGGVLSGGGTYDISGLVVYKGIGATDLISEIGGGVNVTLRQGYELRDTYGNPDFSSPAFADALQALQKIDAGATLTLTDSADLNDSTGLQVDGTLNVQNGATLEGTSLTTTGHMLLAATSSITATTFTQMGAGSDTEIDGTLFANVDLQNGLLHGDGTIDGNLTQEGGTLHPGNSPGALSITGNYTMGPGAFLQIDFDSSDPLGVAGLDWSFLNITGNAQLDGIILVNLLHGMTFHLGDLFQIAHFGSVLPNPLLTVQFLELGGGLHFDSRFIGNDLDLQVSADATPEPGTIAMLAGGLAGLVWLRRRRSK